MAERKKGRRPDWNLSALDKVTEKRGDIGAAWTNPDGSIAIRLNMNVVIDSRTQDLVITLFKCDGRAKGVPETPTEVDEQIPY